MDSGSGSHPNRRTSDTRAHEHAIFQTAIIENFSDSAIETGRILCAGSCDFILSAASPSQFPASHLPDIAFAGRSNVGKSSLINALTGRKTLARTSRTPGRTQHINFFNLQNRLHLVDLPGYGFAKAPKSAISIWTRLIQNYLRGRQNLRRVMLLIDSRHGVKDTDKDIFSMLDASAVPYQVVLTKIDKISRHAQDDICLQTVAALKPHPAAYPHIILTSAEKKQGLACVRASLATLALPA